MYISLYKNMSEICNKDNITGGKSRKVWTFMVKNKQ